MKGNSLGMSLKLRKRIFYVMMFVAFLAVVIFEFLTPYMSDDIIYYDKVREAQNFFDIFRQEAQHWREHTGRSVAHLILRIFLYLDIKAYFNIVVSLVFVLLSLLIYFNVTDKKEYDIRLYGFILVMLWFFNPAIGDTVFWEDGACNYLFTTTIIMSFVTVYRLSIRNNRESTPLFATLLFILGVAGGWCNENTSGGLVLFILIELGYYYFKNGKKFSFIKPYMITGFIGALIGYTMLIVSPGNYGRLETTEEEHTGILAFLARFLKITLAIKDNYLVLIAVFAVLVILGIYLCRDNEIFTDKIRSMAMFALLFLATCYALIMVPSSEIRSFFGASVFLMTGVAQGICLVSKAEIKLLQGVLTSIVVIYALVFTLGYFEDGANLARIRRELLERDAFAWSEAEAGKWDFEVPMLRPQWENRFSKAYEADYTDDSDNWINLAMAVHYGVGTITGVPREEWTQY